MADLYASRIPCRSPSAWLPRPVLLLVALCSAASLGVPCAGRADDADGSLTKVYWVHRLDPDQKVVIYEFSRQAATMIDLRDLHIWKHAPLDQILPRVFVTLPDVRGWFLREGFARLRDGAAAAADRDTAAQEEARTRRKGLWADTGPPAAWEWAAWPAWLSWNTIKDFIVLYGGLAAVLAFLLAMLRIVLKWLRRRQVPLVFLGLGSTGKTWLWARLQNPELTAFELEKLEQSDAMMVEVARRPEPMGKFVVTPVYVDTPGAKPGVQVNALLRRPGLLTRRFVPAKSVWVVMLATTPNSLVSRSSDDALKIDSGYIREQLGYLGLPIGMLTAGGTPKPAVVILTLAKFDLFSDREPSHEAAAAARRRLEELFASHTARMREACRLGSIPFFQEVCSAREGWRTQAIHNRIKDALFGA